MTRARQRFPIFAEYDSANFASSILDWESKGNLRGVIVQYDWFYAKEFVEFRNGINNSLYHLGAELPKFAKINNASSVPSVGAITRSTEIPAFRSCLDNSTRPLTQV